MYQIALSRRVRALAPNPHTHLFHRVVAASRAGAGSRLPQSEASLHGRPVAPPPPCAAWRAARRSSRRQGRKQAHAASEGPRPAHALRRHLPVALLHARRRPAHLRRCRDGVVQEAEVQTRVNAEARSRYGGTEAAEARSRCGHEGWRGADARRAAHVRRCAKVQRRRVANVQRHARGGGVELCKAANMCRCAR